MTAAGVGDGGLQSERTVLAWRRTALAAGCVAVLSLRAWAYHPTLTNLVTLTLTAAMVLTVAACGWHLTRQTPGSMYRARCQSLMLSISALVSCTGMWLLLYA